MKCDYEILDIVRQEDHFLVYRASGADGIPVHLTRLMYPEVVLTSLRQGGLERALAGLKALEHPCLRPVIDGGIDPIDSQPWVVNRIWDGVSLEEKVTAGLVREEDLELLKRCGRALLASIHGQEGAVDLDPREIIFSQSRDGQATVTFAIDALVWFRDMATGYAPGHLRNASRDLEALLQKLQKKEKPGARLQLASGPVVGSSLTTARSLPRQKTEVGGVAPVMIFLVLLLLGGGGIWFMKRNRDHEKPSDPVTTAQPALEKVLKQPVSAKVPGELPEAQEEQDAGEVQEEEKNLVVIREPRPGAVEEMPLLSAAGMGALGRNVGSWVRVTGRVQSLSSEGELAFQESNLKAKAATGTFPTAAVGLQVTVAGYLISRGHLEVDEARDLVLPVVEVSSALVADTQASIRSSEGPEAGLAKPKAEEAPSEPVGEVLGMGDREKVRALKGKTVAVRGKVLTVKKSGSGKTFYAFFSDERPEFGLAVRKREAQAALNLNYLREFEGKEIIVTGRAGVEKAYRGGEGRVLVFIERLDQIQLP